MVLAVKFWLNDAKPQMKRHLFSLSKEGNTPVELIE